MGRKKAALVLLGGAALLAGEDLSQQGAAAVRAGRYEEAERIYRQLSKSFPKEAGWHGNLGLALHSQGKLKAAVQALEQSLKLRPSAGLSIILGFDYLKLGEACKAIIPLERTDRIEALADAYAGCKRYREAAQLYQKLGDVRLAARSFWHARDYAEARRLYTSLLSSHAKEPEFNYEYGDTLARVESAEAAIPYLEKATSLLPARAALGKAYMEAGRFDDAIPHLEAAAGTDSDLLLPLSRAYKAKGRAAEADRALAEYRKKLQN